MKQDSDEKLFRVADREDGMPMSAGRPMIREIEYSDEVLFRVADLEDGMPMGAGLREPQPIGKEEQSSETARSLAPGFGESTVCV